MFHPVGALLNKILEMADCRAAKSLGWPPRNAETHRGACVRAQHVLIRRHVCRNWPLMPTRAARVAWITVIHQIGSASAAYLAGVLRIAFGTYLEALMLSGVLLIVAALMMLFIGAGTRVRQPEAAATSLGSLP